MTSPKQLKLTVTLLLMLHTMCVATIAYAEPAKPNPAAAQLQKAQGMLRQLSQEKVSLEAEKTAFLYKIKQLEAEVAKIAPLQVEVDRYKAELKAVQASNASLQTNVQSMQTQASKAAQRERNLDGKLQETVAQAELIDKDNQLLVASVQEREQWIKQCGEKNQKLVEANLELVGKYKAKGFWDKVVNVEPFTGIGQVKTENLEQEYQFKLEDLKTLSFTNNLDGQTASDLGAVNNKSLSESSAEKKTENQ
jgi:chromosome segregation ATPase